MAKMFPIQQTRFPMSFAHLSSALPEVLNDAQTIQPFLANSGLTLDEAKDALRMGSTAPLIFGSSLGATYGQFDPEVPDRIEIGIDVLKRFEQDSTSPEGMRAKQFLVAKVLHEMCHWGCFRKQIPDNDQAGEAFEAAVFQKELDGWWLSTAGPPGGAEGAALGGGAVDPRVFTDPRVRADQLKQQLTGAGTAPGRTLDPQHAVLSGEDVAQGMPRGYRNNNPGNIRRSTSAWRGLSDPSDMKPFQRLETSFCVFREPEWGLRAVASLMLTYRRDFGLDTPRKLISRWAPAGDNNDVDTYARAVAQALGTDADQTIDVRDLNIMNKLLRAICRHENGDRPPYADMQYDTALLLLQ